jgi:hypothetical protein
MIPSGERARGCGPGNGNAERQGCGPTGSRRTATDLDECRHTTDRPPHTTHANSWSFRPVFVNEGHWRHIDVRCCRPRKTCAQAQLKEANGAEGDRTLNLRIANAALSQLSYRPSWFIHFKVPSRCLERKLR